MYNKICDKTSNAFSWDPKIIITQTKKLKKWLINLFILKENAIILLCKYRFDHFKIPFCEWLISFISRRLRNRNLFFSIFFKILFHFYLLLIIDSLLMVISSLYPLNIHCILGVLFFSIKCQLNPSRKNKNNPLKFLLFSTIKKN